MASSATPRREAASQHFWRVARSSISTAAMALGLAVCYAFGTAWFLVAYARTAGPMGLWAALGLCVFPFVAPDLLKIALAMLLSHRLARYLK